MNIRATMRIKCTKVHGSLRNYTKKLLSHLVENRRARIRVGSEERLASKAGGRLLVLRVRTNLVEVDRLAMSCGKNEVLVAEIGVCNK